MVLCMLSMSQGRGVDICWTTVRGGEFVLGMQYVCMAWEEPRICISS